MNDISIIASWEEVPTIVYLTLCYPIFFPTYPAVLQVKGGIMVWVRRNTTRTEPLGYVSKLFV